MHNDCFTRITNANKPNATHPKLKTLYSQLFRPQYKKPGGTAGELLREARSGGELVHLEKAEARITELSNFLTKEGRNLNKLDRQSAERVLNDLRYAVQEAKKR